MLDPSATEAVSAATPRSRATPLRHPFENAQRAIIGRPPEPAGAAECSIWHDINPFNGLGVRFLKYGCAPVPAAAVDIPAWTT